MLFPVKTPNRKCHSLSSFPGHNYKGANQKSNNPKLAKPLEAGYQSYDKPTKEHISYVTIFAINVTLTGSLSICGLHILRWGFLVNLFKAFYKIGRSIKANGIGNFTNGRI